MYCVPVLSDFWTTLQWLRELRRRHDERMVAVTFRVPDEERVHVGRYDLPHVESSAAECAAWVRKNPAGAEVVLARSVRKRELVGVREITQLVGWTNVPEKIAWDCVCSACLTPGLPDRFRRIRAAYLRSLDAARKAATIPELVRALGNVATPLEAARRRIPPTKVLGFARHPDARVRIAAAGLYGHFKWSAVGSVLGALAHADPDDAVRAAAIRASWRVVGLRRAGDLFGDSGPNAASVLVDIASDEWRNVGARLRVLERAARYDDLFVNRQVAAAAAALSEEDDGDEKDFDDDVRRRLRNLVCPR